MKGIVVTTIHTMYVKDFGEPLYKSFLREELVKLLPVQRDRVDNFPVSKVLQEGDRTVLVVNLPSRILQVGGVEL